MKNVWQYSNCVSFALTSSLLLMFLNSAEDNIVKLAYSSV